MKRFPKLLLIFVLTLAMQKAVLAQPVSAQNDFEISKNIDIFITAYKQLNTNYVDEVNPGQLIKTAIDAMLESLDPYTVYIPESEIEDYRFMTTGHYGGIGAIIFKRGDFIYISEPYEGAPADKAGLKAGDKVLEVNGNSTKGKTVDEVSTVLKGQPGSEITLLVQRDTTLKPYEVKLNREEIIIKNVQYYGMVNPSIGYINLSEFRQDAGKEVKEAFSKLSTDNPSLKGLILDLRGNGGGLLNEAVNIANIFIDKGQLICSTKGKIRDRNNVHKTLNPAVDIKIPLVVLVDGGSASASEIVAGAIQDLDRGVVVGKKTFGKGLVQNIFPLSYNSQMKVTVAKYYIPSGRCVQAIDYFHKDEDGNAPKVPDSLLKEFKTKAGRSVFEGSGIQPDVNVELPKIPDILYTLVSKNLIFDFAVNFYRKHQSIEPAKSFIVTDEIFEQFEKFLQDKDYTYTTASEISLSEFKKKAEEDNYFEKVKSQYSALNEMLLMQKKNDLIANKNDIKRLIKAYLVPLYYYQKGRIESSLSDDEDVKKAIEILDNQTLYQSILNGTYRK